MISNAQRLVSALEEVGLRFTLAPAAIVAPKPREMLLFVLYLFESLPPMMPKAMLEFQGSVHMPIMKYIELTNPSKRPISYDIRIEGCQDFTVEKPSLSLGPKGSDQATKSIQVRAIRLCSSWQHALIPYV